MVFHRLLACFRAVLRFLDVEGAAIPDEARGAGKRVEEDVVAVAFVGEDVGDQVPLHPVLYLQLAVYRGPSATLKNGKGGCAGQHHVEARAGFLKTL